uniref:(California timema) hypothetical protein n=1 Tax=Timema californicum TaxID=61474 RepID=A0A7R9J6A0_TIMCA|nr:unnamed protein product [Timema californicum]
MGRSRFESRSGIEFVQLSQNIQKAIGEPVQMHCKINKAVEECQWTWQPINETIKTPEVKRRFQPAGDERRDCIKLRFMEQPENIRVALGTSALLRCVATAAVEECRWTWRPLTEPDKEEVLVKHFLPFGNHNRNCSVRFRSVQQTQEGLWGCTAIGPPNSSLQSTPLAKLEVYQPVEIKFIEYSQDIHIAAGGHIKLHCTTSSYVEMCRWTWEPIHPSSINVTPTIKQEFPATGKDGRNCSYRLEKVETEDEGIWVCSVRGQGMEEFVQAPPTKLLLDNELVSVYSGLEATNDGVNWDNTYEVELCSMKGIERSNFADVKLKRKNKVKTATLAISIGVRSEDVAINPDQLLNRVVCIAQETQNFKYYFQYEFSSYQLALF